MSESRIVEIYECQVYSSFKKWYPYEKLPYHYKSESLKAAEEELERCEVPYQINLPSSEWRWVGEWDIQKSAGLTDEDGWEYASRISRFSVESRAPRTEPALWSKARRRLWTRVMRRELSVKSVDTAKILSRTQAGLASIHTARTRIEEIVSRAPESATNSLMVNLVSSVKKNIRDVIAGLDQLHSVLQQENKTGKPNSAIAIVKKLRNDVLKEEQAITKALQRQNGPEARGGAAVGAAKNGSAATAAIDAKVAGCIREGSRVYGQTAQSSECSGQGETRSSVISSSNGSGFNGGGCRTVSVELREGLEQVDTYLKNAEVADSKSSKGSESKASGKKVAVIGGTRQSFDPTMFSSNAELVNGEPMSGVFMDRSRREQRILEKLIPIDETTVMQGIIDERAVEIEKMNRGIQQVHEMFVDLSRLVKEQKVEINEIFKHVEVSHAKSKAALGHIIRADQLQKQGQCCIS